MILTKEQQQEFEEIVKPVIKFVNDNCDPHTYVIIDNTYVRLVESIIEFRTEDFWKD